MEKTFEIYQIKVALRGSQPLIWRRVQVMSDTSLARFHGILQCVMGWEDTHVHRFVIRGACYGVPEQDQPGSPKTKDERAYMLRDVAPHAGQQFAYDYDFGDYWQHILVVERTISREEGVLYPLCLAGARACPPEDVGGIGRYEHFLEAIANPAHPEHDDFTEWIGGQLRSRGVRPK